MAKVSVSLFSEAGGLDVGFEAAGFRTVFANEFDHDAADAWRSNRPENAGAMVEGDIADHLGELAPLAGGVDVLFGGPPCQGFSVAGKMDPADERSRLVWTFLDAVGMLRPRAFVMENVAALGHLSKWAAVRDGIVKRGARLGYDVAFDVWHTPDFGVPQNRDRVIFVGVLGGNVSLFAEAMAARFAPAPTAREVLLSAGRYGTDENPQTCTAHVTLAKRPVMRSSAYAGMLVNGAGRPIDLDGIAATLPASMGGQQDPDSRPSGPGGRDARQLVRDLPRRPRLRQAGAGRGRGARLPAPPHPEVGRSHTDLPAGLQVQRAEDQAVPADRQRGAVQVRGGVARAVRETYLEG